MKIVVIKEGRVRFTGSCECCGCKFEIQDLTPTDLDRIRKTSIEFCPTCGSPVLLKDSLRALPYANSNFNITSQLEEFIFEGNSNLKHWGKRRWNEKLGRYYD